MSGDTFGTHTRGGAGEGCYWHLSRDKWPGVLLNILQCTGYPGIYQAQNVNSAKTEKPRSNWIHILKQKKKKKQNPSHILCIKNSHFSYKLKYSCIQFSHLVVSNSLQLHGLQHTRLPVHCQLLELTRTHVHWVSDAIHPSHALLSPSPAFNLSQQFFFKESQGILY